MQWTHPKIKTAEFSKVDEPEKLVSNNKISSEALK